MPLQTRVIGGLRGAAVCGWIPNREAIALAVVPRAVVGNTESQFQGKPLRDLPAILHEPLDGMVRLVMQRVEILLVILSGVAREQIGISAAGRPAGPVGLYQLPVAVPVPGLVVD